MITAFHHLQLVSDGTITSGKSVLIEGGKVISIIDDNAVPTGTQPIDLHNAYLAPGFVDLQIYGSGSPLFFGDNPSIAALAQMEISLLNEGCTGFLATIATNANNVIEQGIEAAKAYRDQSKGNFLGLHLEGPYLNVRRKGAHPAEFIKKATLAEVKGWIGQADGVIKMMTIAPELQDQEVIDYLYQQGVVLSCGHSNATYAEGKAFLNKPITAVTHLYNAMPQIHHREPGYIPAVFEERPYTSIVADGVHVDFAMIRLAKRELGDKLFLITDAVTAASGGVYQHRYKDGKYVMPDGTLSGSSLTMLKAVANCVEHVGIDLAEAINMASLYPAQLIGTASKGKIEVGYNADMVIFTNDFEIKGTFFKGEYLTNTT